MSKITTRGEMLGLKPAPMKRKSKAAIAAMRKRLEDLSLLWGDADSVVTNGVESVLASVDELEKMLGEAVEYLGEQVV